MDAISAAEAAALLGVKRETLYVYVSRGLLSSLPGAGTSRTYRRDEVTRLKARSEARAGRGSPAAGALSFGDPVIDSAITRLDAARGPVYRGHAAVDLARRGVSFEAASVLLWSGRLPGEARPDFLAGSRRLPALGAGRSLLEGIEAGILTLRRDWPDLVEPEVELRLARVLVGSLQRWLREALQLKPRASARESWDRALVVIADHELNPSTFTARVVASTGAGLAACVHAALLALSGPRHGGACDRIEALLDEVGTPKRALDVVRARLRRGEEVPGFHTAIYPNGDPRTAPLLELPRVAGGERTAVVRSVVQAMRELRGDIHGDGGGPSVDLGLVAVARSLGLPKGAATALFALGRASGWIAHVLEQRASGEILRPRARYVDDGE